MGLEDGESTIQRGIQSFRVFASAGEVTSMTPPLLYPFTRRAGWSGEEVENRSGEMEWRLKRKEMRENGRMTKAECREGGRNWKEMESEERTSEL